VRPASRVHTGLNLVTAILAVIAIFIALQARGLSACQASRAP
jgi:hypothetical protein